MSVFTPLARPELETFLAPYGLGRLLDFQGIAAGSENTNFFISLEQGEFVLTLVERGPVAEMPFFIELLDVLHDAAAYRIRAVTQLLENLAFREQLSSDAVVLQDFAQLLAIPLRDGCDLLDVIIRRLNSVN